MSDRLVAVTKVKEAPASFSEVRQRLAPLGPVELGSVLAAAFREPLRVVTIHLRKEVDGAICLHHSST